LTLETGTAVKGVRRESGLFEIVHDI